MPTEYNLPRILFSGEEASWPQHLSESLLKKGDHADKICLPATDGKEKRSGVIGNARYCTTKSVSRGTNLEEKGKSNPAKLKLPNIDLNLVNETNTSASSNSLMRPSPGFINQQKYCMRLKGFTVNEVYRSNRRKFCSGDPETTRLVELPNLDKTAVQCGFKKTINERTTKHSAKNGNEIPGLIVGNSLGQKFQPLGGILSPERMGRLLGTKAPVRMENCFNFYM